MAMKQIEGTILSLSKNFASGRTPILKYHSAKNVTNCNLNKSRMKYSIFSKNGEIAIIIHLLSKIYKLLATDTTITRRELYYQETALLKGQSQLDKLMNKISYLLGVPQWELGVLATSKGLVAGALLMTTYFGNMLECSEQRGSSIPQEIPYGVKLVSKSKFVLLVEKDAIFHKLIEEGFVNKHRPCILITGKGTPDFCTRLLLKNIWEQLSIPIFALMDADPYGIEIMLIYRFGSKAQSHIADFLAVPAIRWLGVHPTDISDLNAKSEPLSQFDISKAKQLLIRPFTANNPKFNDQVNKLIEKGLKSEIEGIASISNSYLTNVYIPSKIISKTLI